MIFRYLDPSGRAYRRLWGGYTSHPLRNCFHLSCSKSQGTIKHDFLQTRRRSQGASTDSPSEAWPPRAPTSGSLVDSLMMGLPKGTEYALIM